jgi:phytoene synthase
MKELFDEISIKTSIITTHQYSTSFSMGIKTLHPSIRKPIYAIYGFVRLGDEIVDSFHDYDKEKLFSRFKEDVYSAIENKISLNPILNSFQHVVHRYQIDREIIEAFIYSMEQDLHKKEYLLQEYEKYILGSAEVVGLMCLRVFCKDNDELYNKLKVSAMKLGSAYQKINFLRDIKADYFDLGRTYFPSIDLKNFNNTEKEKIMEDIESDFKQGIVGIKMLPRTSRFGVYMSYMYYYNLLNKVKRISPQVLLQKRTRISNLNKYFLFLQAWIRYNLGFI